MHYTHPGAPGFLRLMFFQTFAEAKMTKSKAKQIESSRLHRQGKLPTKSLSKGTCFLNLGE